MMKIFGKDYASLYDQIYQNKDYDGECDLIEKLFNQYCPTKPHKIVDFGCGTGNHAIRLQKRGYLLTGVDRSHDMIVQAREKTDYENLKIPYQCINIQNYQGDELFDAAIMMFAVLGYQISNQELIKVLMSVHSNLEQDGIFIADFWYGPAVLTTRPETRFQTIVYGEKKIIRLSSGVVDSLSHKVTVDISTLEIENNRVITDVNEKHEMRYFFPKEIELLCQLTGFHLLLLSSWDQPGKIPDELSWNAFLVLKKATIQKINADCEK